MIVRQLAVCRPDGTIDRKAGFGIADDGVERLHGASRVRADGGLARQHDRIDAVLDGVRRVVHFRARRPRLGRHRLEDLGGDDHRNAVAACGARDLFLRARHALERHLEPEVAARHHHRVARGENLVQVLDRLRALELRDERHVRAARFGHQLPRLSQIRLRLHEADCDHVDAERQAEAQIVGVLRRDGRHRQRHAGRRDAFVLADGAAFDDDGVNLLAVGADDPELDEPVGEEQSIAGTDILREAGERCRQPARFAWRIARRNHQLVARLDDDRLAAFDRAGADFRPAEILKDRHDSPRALCRGADAREGCRLRLLRAVREVEAEDVGAGGDQRVEHAVGLARRPDGGDDLRVPHESGFRVQGSGFWVLVPGSEFWFSVLVLGSRFSVLGSSFSVL